MTRRTTAMQAFVLVAVMGMTTRAWCVEACGVRLAPPKGWRATPREAGRAKSCSIGLKPKEWAQLRRREPVFDIAEFAIYLTVSDLPAARFCRKVGLERVGDIRDELPERLQSLTDDEWVITSRMWSKAERINGNGWFGGIGEAVIWVGLKDAGGHTSGAEWRAVLVERDGRHRTAALSCEAPADCETLLPAVTRSFEFLP